MKRTAHLLVLALTLAPIVVASDPLQVTAVLPPKPYYVGQGIEVAVEVGPGPGPPAVEPPRIKGAEVFSIPPDPARPSTSRFVVVPAHAGPLDLPAFRARSGDRSGASKSTRLAVANVPPEGRTSAFLGGVGPFEVRAEAKPSDVRPGETLEFRVSLSGPAAWGSVRRLDLSGWASPTLKVEALADSFQAAGVPIRTFRYRVRPLKPGRLVLPPFAVAAFDPATRRYATKTTSGVAIRVEEPPRFDPSRLDYGPIALSDKGLRPSMVALLVATFAVGSGSALVAWLVARGRRRSRASLPRRLALELARGLEGGGDEVEAARAVVEALTTYLHRVGGRPSGVLTPLEALAGFERLTGDPALAATAEALVSRCDRARYGRFGGEGGGMTEEARRFFEGVAGVMAGGNREGVGGPGEAVETASDS
jgi:hypothetical protein